MVNIGRTLSSAGVEHRRESYIGPVATSGNGGRLINVNNLNNSQLRDLMNMSPYGISSRPKAGVKAQVIVNDNNNNTVVGIYDNSRPSVEPGEIALYSVGNALIYLTKDGIIMIRTSEATIGIQPDGNIEINGNVNINGTLSLNGTPIEQLWGNP
jgi:phage gp45-like